MGAKDLSQLVNFCSGRLRLPSSAADFPMAFKLTLPPPKSAEHPDDYLPIAQTCFFSLSLPRYSSTAVSEHVQEEQRERGGREGGRGEGLSYLDTALLLPLQSHIIVTLFGSLLFYLL